MGLFLDLMKNDISLNGMLVCFFNSLWYYVGEFVFGMFMFEELDFFLVYYECLIVWNDKVFIWEEDVVWVI